MIHAKIPAKRAVFTIRTRFIGRTGGMTTTMPLVGVFSKYGLTNLQTVMDKMSLQPGEEADGTTISIAG